MVGTAFDTATTALCTKLIVHSENEINKYLSKRYDVSAFTSTSLPPILTSWAETLTEGYMYKRMSRGGKEALAQGDSLIKGVLENLKMVSEYKLDIIDSGGDVLSDMSNTSYRVLSTTDTYSPTFNEDSDLKWKTDQDKLDDIESERE